MLVIRSLGQEPLDAAAAPWPVAGPAARVARCVRTLEWDCLRVNLASQEAARAALEGPRDWLERCTPRLQQTGRGCRCRRRDTRAHGGDAARGPVPLRRIVSGRDSAEQLESVGLPVVDGAAFEGSRLRAVAIRRSRRGEVLLHDALDRWARLHATMKILGVPRRTAALIGAKALGAAVQGQFQFVLPWMLLTAASRRRRPPSRPGSSTGRCFSLRSPAGAASDNTDPRRLMRAATLVMLFFCALYPLAALAGHDWFILILIAAVAVGSSPQLLRGCRVPGHRRHDGRRAARSSAPTHCARPSIRQPCSAARSSGSCSFASAEPRPCCSASARCCRRARRSSPSCPS